MSNQPLSEESVISSPETETSFADILSQFETEQRHTTATGSGVDGSVIAVTGELVFVDIGQKTEGVIAVTEFGANLPKPGDLLQVSIAGRNAEGYYQLSRIKVAVPKDWSAMEKAYAEKTAIAGTVSAVVKGGLSVDIGVRAFMPASRSGARDAKEIEDLVGKPIQCRIIKLDVADEDVVVDRRSVLEEAAKAARESYFESIHEGDVREGTVRSVMEYGAFIDIGGIDGLLHVADISWGRVGKPADVLNVGDKVQVKVVKVDAARRRISLGLKQLQPDPWTVAAEKYTVGQRVRGAVTRTTDFGAFVELEPGLEGLIHLSEMSWTKKVRKPTDVVHAGEQVEAVILGVNPADRRIALGLKQALGDPWAEVASKFPEGSVVEGPVVSLAKFGAFIDLGDGIEGMVHVGDIALDRRIDHPNEVLKAGEVVRAAVLGIDKERRRIRLGMKQLQPTATDEYIAERKEGEVVTGRVARVAGGEISVELGDGVFAICAPDRGESAASGFWEMSAARADVGSLSEMLANKWKLGGGGSPRSEGIRPGQIRSFKIVRLDPQRKRIEVEAV